MTVYYKVQENGNLMSYMDVKIDAPFIHAMSMWWEYDLDTTEEIKDLKLVGRPSDFIMGYQCRMPLPWPAADRVAIVCMCSYFNRDNHSILGISKDIEPGSTFFGNKIDTIPEKYKRV